MSSSLTMILLAIAGTAVAGLLIYCYELRRRFRQEQGAKQALQEQLQEAQVQAQVLQKQWDEAPGVRDEVAKVAAGLVEERVRQHTKELSAMLSENNKREAKDYREHLQAETRDIHARLERTWKAVNNLAGVADKSSRAFDALRHAVFEPRAAGRAGETALGNCLRSFHLQKGVDYFLQPTMSAGQQDGHGGAGWMRPDAIVRLANDSFLIIDSKSSRFLYERELTETEVTEAEVTEATGPGSAEVLPDTGFDMDFDTAVPDVEVAAASLSLQPAAGVKPAQALADSMRGHIKRLAGKDYRGRITNLTSLFGGTQTQQAECITVMWLPSEAALERVREADSSLFDFAHQHRVTLCGPSALWALLAVAERQVAAVRQAENMKKILTEIDQVLKSVKVLRGHADKARKRLAVAHDTMERFHRAFEGDFVRRADTLIHAYKVEPPPGWQRLPPPEGVSLEEAEGHEHGAEQDADLDTDINTDTGKISPLARHKIDRQAAG